MTQLLQISKSKMLEFIHEDLIPAHIIAGQFRIEKRFDRLCTKLCFLVSLKIPRRKLEGTEKVDYTVYIWYNVSIKYRRCFYDRTTAEIDAKSIHGNI